MTKPNSNRWPARVAGWKRGLLWCVPPWLAVLSVSAQEWQEPESGWFVRGGAKALFNIKASVTKFPKKVSPGVFDNGYVLPDDGGLVSGKTWNWGYDSDTQINGDFLEMDLLTNLPKVGSFEDETDDPSLGGEVLFGSSLYEFELKESRARVGWELGYGFNEFSVDHASQASGVASLATSSYDTGGITMPAAPYRGTAMGPGPLIDLVPTSNTLLTSPSVATSTGELQSYLHIIKFGLWFDYEWSERFLTSCSFGYASIFTDTQWKYTEAVTFDDPGIPDIGPSENTVGHQDWKPGVYMQWRAHYQLNRLLQAYVGGDFHTSQDMDFTDEGHHVVLDYGAMFGVTGGLSFQF